jgi:hypothetical protein
MNTPGRRADSRAKRRRWCRSLDIMRDTVGASTDMSLTPVMRHHRASCALQPDLRSDAIHRRHVRLQSCQTGVSRGQFLARLGNPLDCRCPGDAPHVLVHLAEEVDVQEPRPPLARLTHGGTCHHLDDCRDVRRREQRRLLRQGRGVDVFRAIHVRAVFGKVVAEGLGAGHAVDGCPPPRSQGAPGSIPPRRQQVDSNLSGSHTAGVTANTPDRRCCQSTQTNRLRFLETRRAATPTWPGRYKAARACS